MDKETKDAILAEHVEDIIDLLIEENCFQLLVDAICKNLNNKLNQLAKIKELFDN